MHTADWCVIGTGETEDGYYQSLEKAELVRSGSDVTILCYSRMRYVVMQAVQQLENEGYDPEVDISAHQSFSIVQLSQTWISWSAMMTVIYRGDESVIQ